MITVQLSGGLGNQMFQYAFALALRAAGHEVKLDDTTEYGRPGDRAPQLDVFGITYERPTEAEERALLDNSMKLIDRIRRKLTGRKTLLYHEASTNYDSEAVNRDPAYLEGCFQSERYFASVKEEVRKAYSWRRVESGELPLPPSMQDLPEKIRSTEAVSVHIRRGDYLDPANGGLYTGICTKEYYEKAFAMILEKHPNAVFYLFSNDPAWVKEEFQGENFVVVEGTTEETGYLDMYLMTLCKHHIIANSSFSWWGAWLGPEDGMILAPKTWLNGKDCRDIYTERMIRL